MMSTYHIERTEDRLTLKMTLGAELERLTLFLPRILFFFLGPLFENVMLPFSLLIMLFVGAARIVRNRSKARRGRVITVPDAASQWMTTPKHGSPPVSDRALLEGTRFVFDRKRGTLSVDRERVYRLDDVERVAIESHSSPRLPQFLRTYRLNVIMKAGIVIPIDRGLGVREDLRELEMLADAIGEVLPGKVVVAA